MPWTVGDVERHKKGLSDSQKEAWVKIANSTLAACQKKGGSDCEGKAVRIANAMAPKTTEELEIVKELIEIVSDMAPPPWKIDDVDTYVKDLSDSQKKVWEGVLLGRNKDGLLCLYCNYSIAISCPSNLRSTNRELYMVHPIRSNYD